MNGTSGFLAGYRKTISALQSFSGLDHWTKRGTLTQDAKKGLPSHPPNPGASRRTLSQARPRLCGGPSFHVSRITFHGSRERSENAAGGLFQHPCRSAVFYLPITIAYRFLNEHRHQFGTGARHLFPTKELPRMAPQFLLMTRF